MQYPPPPHQLFWTLKLKKRKIIKSDGAIFLYPLCEELCYLLGK
jgi:hypothetical protein